MKAGYIQIYETENPDPYYQQFNGSEVMLLEEDFGDGSIYTYRWLVRHCKSGIRFYANLNELKEKQNGK